MPDVNDRRIRSADIKYWPLVVFALVEVTLFNGGGLIQGCMTAVEYLFVLVAVLVDFRRGVMYFIAFTLLAVGGWSYITQQELPDTFWGTRVAGVSANIIATALIFLVGVFKGHFNLKDYSTGIGFRALSIFVLYSILAGAFACFLRINAFDNFVGDLAVFLPCLLYVPLLCALTAEQLTSVCSKGISVAIIAMLFSQVLGRTFDYGDGYQFVLMSGFAYLGSFAVFFFPGSYSRWHYFALCATTVYLLSAGPLFIGGKTIVIFGATIIWGVTTSSRVALVACFIALLAVGFRVQVTGLANTRLAEGTLLEYKVSQLGDAVAGMGIDELSTQKTSMGNIAAEGRTIAAYFMQTPIVSLLGRGLGAGVPDIFGYLTPAVGPGAGYRYEDAARDDFVRLHLPLYQFALRGGIIALAAFVYFVIYYAASRSIFSFATAVLLVMVFTNSKEMVLLTMLTMRCADLVRRKEIGFRNGHIGARSPNGKRSPVASNAVENLVRANARLA